jgi:hypothetical protein
MRFPLFLDLLSGDVTGYSSECAPGSRSRAESTDNLKLAALGAIFSREPSDFLGELVARKMKTRELMERVEEKRVSFTS